MPTPRIYHTEAIVLSRFELGEADRVLTLLTPEDGKLKAIAKGVRRPRSRIGGAVEPFAELELLLVARRAPSTSSPRRSVGHAWLALRDRLESTATAWYLGELAERAVEERAFAYPVYALLRRAYQLLDDGMAPGRVARWFEFGLADALGMRPEVERCVECDRVARGGRAVPLGAGAGRRAVRPPPAAAGRGGRRSRSTRSSCCAPTAAWTSRPSPALRLPRGVEAEVESALRRFMRHVLERDARSLAFLDEVRARR